MKKIIQTTFITGVLLTLFSFTIKSEFNFAGTYGVTANDPSAIELKLNEDKSFTFKDFSNPEKQIDVKGNWEIKNNQVHLKNYNSEFSFHTKWKILNDGTVAKSRKGLTFYTLCKK
jgi:hypothetical protein